METKISDFISGLRLGEMKQYKNIAAIALFAGNAGGPEYKTLDEAISSGMLKITEASTGGNVPELIAENKGESMILLLDGEEVVGAKQNRILNTTVLLDKLSKTIIPVSCVEAHRWSYTSPVFEASDNLLNYDIRRAKTSAVHASLRAGSRYMSDQSEIWGKIDEMSEDLNVKSNTAAMKDVYKSFDEELGQYLKNFAVEPGQGGIFVFIDGRIAGFDIVSQPDVYAMIHPKLLKSYCLDALRKEFLRQREAIKISEQTLPIPSVERAKYFLEEIKQCNESHFKSAGLGEDYRYEGGYIIGSALLFFDAVIHMAFFKNEEAIADGAGSDKTGNMSSYRDRMRNRRVQ